MSKRCTAPVRREVTQHHFAIPSTTFPQGKVVLGAQSLYRNVDPVFNDQREYENGNTPVVRTVFEQLQDETIYILNTANGMMFRVKNFDDWNNLKKGIDGGKRKLYKARDIWWCSLGTNVGFEQDGTGKNHERPVVVLRGFSKDVCLIVPLTTSTKKNKYHVTLGKVDGKLAAAIISQVRLIDTRRFIDKIGMLDKEKFEEMKNAVKVLL